MSDGQTRTDFAGRVIALDLRSYPRAWSRQSISGGRCCGGSRLDRKKVKGEKRLSHALLRSAFGRSED